MLLRFFLSAVVVCPLLAQDAKVAPQSVKIEFDSAKPETIQSRLAKAPGSNAERAAVLHEMFEGAGCSGAMLSDQQVPDGRQPNVICSSTGQGGSVIVVGAHLDFREPGQGAVEDWSGASLLPSLFESLHDTPRRHTFVFVAFTDRDKERLGSNFYLNSLNAAQRAKIKAMVNLDALGLSSTKVQLDGCDKVLSMRMASIAKALGLKVGGANSPVVADSDSLSFARFQIPVITIHSLLPDNAAIVGTPKDVAAAVNMTDYYDSYRLVAAYLVYLDQMLD
jgi:hypothetical protein